MWIPQIHRQESHLPAWWGRKMADQKDQIEEASVSGVATGRCRLLGSRLQGNR